VGYYPFFVEQRGRESEDMKMKKTTNNSNSLQKKKNQRNCK